jgi:MHS family proline/betaine transporter-like MFS transporter
VANPELTGSPLAESEVEAFDVSTNSVARVGFAGLVGTTIEYFDFSVYSFLTVYFAPLFFGTHNQVTAVLTSLAVFGSAYLVRPLGGAFFGALGDRIGRRPVLVVTILIMGAGGFLVGVLPTYASIGIAAPALLVLLRLIQGFSAGGENVGAATYVAECAPPNRRAVWVALIPAGTFWGFGFAALIIFAVSASIGQQGMADWGWRVPFLLCAPLTLFCLWIRVRLEDSPSFKRMKARSQVVRTPIREAVRGHWPNIIRVAGLTFAGTAPGFLGLVYLGVFLTTTRKFPPTTVYITVASVLIASSASFLLAGRLAEVFGRRRVVVVGSIVSAVLSYPFMLIVATSPSLVVISLALFLFMGLSSMLSGPIYSMMTEFFPGNVRYTATALGYNIGIVVAGGLGPYLSGQLSEWTGSNVAPAYWVMGACLVSLVTLAFTADTDRTNALT